MRCNVRNLSLVSLFATCLVFSAVLRAEERAPRIAVSGEGTASLAPDTAILDLAVVEEADTARAALDANSAAMVKVLGAMKDMGIAERDLQTSGFSIQPRMVYPRSNGNDREAPRIVGYTVRNGLTVKVRDIDQVGAVLDQSVTLGVNKGGSIRFTNDDPSQAIARARAAAVANALDKAATLAAAAGVKTGDILELSEHAAMPGPRPMARAEMMMADSAAGAVPVASGENTYRVTVNLALAIDQ